MARDTWHSLTERVHHQHGGCVWGASVAATPNARSEGDGGKPLCDTCAMLIQRDSVVSLNVPVKSRERE
jgi:hypothetical protein